MAYLDREAFLRSLGVLGAVVLLISLLRAGSWTGKAVGITDGDTIRLLKDGQEIKIRLHGIDAPEEGQPFGARAKQYLSALTFGKEVRAEVLETDKYGRSVALIYLADGRCINHELVRHGIAWWYPQYAQGDTALARLEREAREGGLGLWEDKSAIAPWEWRKGKRGPMAGDPAAPRGPPVGNSGDGTAAGGAAAEGVERVEGGGERAVAQEIVYRTRTGAKYHRGGCRYLKSVIPTTVEEATGMGLMPCSVCGPAGPVVGGVERAVIQGTVVPRNSSGGYSGRCQAITKKGAQCKRGGGVSGYCWQHER